MRNGRYYLIELINQPDEKWHILLDYAFTHASIVEFTLPNNEKKWPPILAQLQDQKIAQFRSRYRWQCKQISTATFLRFKLDFELKAYLKTVEHLTEWQFDTIEDPAFYRGADCVLWTTSHEGFVYLWLEESERESWVKQGFELHPMEDASSPTKQ